MEGKERSGERERRGGRKRGERDYVEIREIGWEREKNGEIRNERGEI